jgi:hypothetical protein
MLVCAITVPLGAQWLKEPTKGIPRTPDGKPNLTAPAPRAPDGKPDLSGLWRMDAGPFARYVGAYEFRSTEDPSQVTVVNVTLSGDEVLLDVGGKDPQPMIPLSETLFSTFGSRLEFVLNEKGQVDHAIFRIVEGDLKGIRK